MTKKIKHMPTFVEFNESGKDALSTFEPPLFIQTAEIRNSMEKAIKKAEAIEKSARV